MSSTTETSTTDTSDREVHYEVYECGGPIETSYSTKPFGELTKDEAHTKARERSRDGLDHCVEEVTGTGDDLRRAKVAEYHHGLNLMEPGQ